MLNFSVAKVLHNSNLFDHSHKDVVVTLQELTWEDFRFIQEGKCTKDLASQQKKQTSNPSSNRPSSLVGWVPRWSHRYGLSTPVWLWSHSPGISWYASTPGADNWPFHRDCIFCLSDCELILVVGTSSSRPGACISIRCVTFPRLRNQTFQIWWSDAGMNSFHNLLPWAWLPVHNCELRRLAHSLTFGSHGWKMGEVADIWVAEGRNKLINSRKRRGVSKWDVHQRNKSRSCCFHRCLVLALTINPSEFRL